jgi:hypothetical protein
VEAAPIDRRTAMKLRDLTAAIRALSTPAERREQIPALLRAIGNALDSVEGRLRYLGECRGIPLELTAITQRAGGNWLQRAQTINGLGDVRPWLESATSAVSRIWDSVGLLSGDAEKAEKCREAFETRFNAAHGIEPMWDLAEMLDTLQGVVGDLDEWGPPGPPASKAKRPEARAA